MPPEDNEPCRVVVVEWDRGHEEVDGILRAEGTDGIILTEMDDLIPDAGYCWLRSDEILNVEDWCTSSGTARSAKLRDALSERIDTQLTTLANLLHRLTDNHATIGVHTRRTGSGELLAGVMDSTTDLAMQFKEIDPNGVLTGELITVGLDDIIRVDWDTDYLRALRALVEFGAPPDH